MALKKRRNPKSQLKRNKQKQQNMQNEIKMMTKLKNSY
jgi:hypothetical protein